MESTGSYWIPVFNLLEGHVKVVLANPEEVKNRKGHKTDRKDAGHLADLLRHNHVKSSYIPTEPRRSNTWLALRRPLEAHSLKWSISTRHDAANGKYRSQPSR
jgi:transposase